MDCVKKDCDYIKDLSECDIYCIQRLALIYTLADQVKKHMEVKR